MPTAHDFVRPLHAAFAARRIDAAHPRGRTSGEIEIGDDDVQSNVVDIAASVSAPAGPGEVPVSRTALSPVPAWR